MIVLIKAIVANEFKKAFEAARLFNNQIRDGVTEGLEYAAAVEDKEEVHDDPEKNKTADEDAKEGEEAGDDQ